LQRLKHLTIAYTTILTPILNNAFTPEEQANFRRIVQLWKGLNKGKAETIAVQHFHGAASPDGGDLG
jgi:hypothetical protein